MSSSSFLLEPEALAMPWVHSPFFDTLIDRVGGNDDQRELARRFHLDGFLVLEGLFEPELLDEVERDHRNLFSPDAQFADSHPKVKMDASDARRRQEAWVVSEAIRGLACHPRVLELLQYLYRRKPIPFQTLNFQAGSEQGIHSDAMHFSSLPSGFLCGVWVALEDVTEDNGPLVYYPGSQGLPELRIDQFYAWAERSDRAAGPNYDLYENYARSVVQGAALEAKRLLVKRGSALIWSANLLHGGTAIRNAESTRLSQVTHYYFEDCIYYSPIHSNAAIGELRLRSVYDLHEDRAVPHSLNGQPIEFQPLSNGNYRVGIPGSFDYTYAWLFSVIGQRLSGRLRRFLAKHWRGPSRGN